MPERSVAASLAGLLLVAATHPALAGSRLLATSGATALEGQAGGGLVPWALLAGYAEKSEIGTTLAYTRVEVDDFTLDVRSANLGWNNRLELGYAQQSLDVHPLGVELRQHVISAKVRLLGDVVYTGVPQVSLGMQYKRLRDPDLPRTLGASRDESLDVYLAASKLWLNAVGGRNLFTNLSLRRTAAHQVGLLGHARNHRWQAEGSVGIFLNRHWVWGMEYRSKPDRLPGLREDDWMNSFVGWFPNKTFAAVLAWADLGSIAGLDDQRGWYLSVQLTP